jgi:O-antigen/teichoic acid export membrane protein
LSSAFGKDNSATLKRVFLQTIISVVLSFATFAFGFIRVYYFSKRLSMDDFGALSLLLTISAFLLYIFTLGSYQFLFKSVNDGPEEKKDAFTVSVIVTAAISVICSLFSFLFADPLTNAFGLSAYKNEFLLMVVSSGTTAIMTIFLYYHYGLGKNNFQNFIQFLRSSLWVGVAILVSLFMDLSLYHIFWIVNISMVTILLISVPWKELKELLSGKLRGENFSRLFNYCIPLMPYFAGVWGIPMIIRTQLNIHEGTKNVAIFSVAYTLMEIVFMFISTITATLSPYFFGEEDRKDKPNLFYNIMLKYSVLSIVLIIPFIFILRYDLITLVASAKYLVAGKYIPLLVFFPLIRVLIIVFEQHYLKTSQTRYLGIVYSVGLLVSFALAFLLVPKFSMYGAIYASLATYFIIFVFLIIRQKGMVDYNYVSIPAILLLAIILWAAVFGLGFLNFSNWLKIIPLGICAILCVSFLPVLSSQEKDKLLVLMKLKK